MKSDPIFRALSPEQLLEVCTLLSFDPLVKTQPAVLLSKLQPPEQLSWLSSNRHIVEEEISSVASWGIGNVEKNYADTVREVAVKFGAVFALGASIEEVERALTIKIWNDAVAKLTPAQVEELKKRAQEIAAKHGKKFGGDVASFAVLSAAQMSGFGIYLLGSTVLGAINGALGLGLGFGAFTGLSSLISTVIGPVGWASLGVAAVMKLASPNYKKLLPVVIFIAANRALSQSTSGSGDASALVARSTSEVAGQRYRKEISPAAKPIAQPGSRKSDIRLPGYVANPPAAQRSMPPQPTLKSVLQPVALPAKIKPYRDPFFDLASYDSGRSKNIDTSAKLPQQVASVAETVAELRADVARSSTEAQSDKKEERKKNPPKPRVLSKRERNDFNLRPENKILRDIALNEVGEDFLNLSVEYQEEVRRMAEVRRMVKQPEETLAPAGYDSGEKILHRPTVKAAIAEPDPEPHEGSKLAEARRWRTTFRRCANLQFSDETLCKLDVFSKNDLHGPFVDKFENLNNGIFCPKHSISGTKQKVWEEECGHSGRVYYHHSNEPKCVYIDLIGDKNSQTRDIEKLRSHSHTPLANQLNGKPKRKK